MKRNRHISLSALAATLLLASCGMMSDDRSDCPVCQEEADNTLRVTLRYDYNMDRANMFNDQAQRATVYVVDPTTHRIVDLQTAANGTAGQPLKEPSFGFNFTELAPGSYQLYATASAPANSSTDLTIGDIITGWTYQLETQQSARLDTIWNTLQPQSVTVGESAPVEAVVPLMRLTKNLSIVLLQTENPTDCQADDYEVTITSPELMYSYDNSAIEHSPMSSLFASHITYSPYSQWTVETLNESQEPVSRTAHFDLSFARLIHHEQSADNARLQIVHKADGKTVLDIDLVYYLSLARNAAQRDYGIQEFLDREHDYHLDVILSGNEWRYMDLSINVMSWSHRIYNEKI